MSEAIASSDSVPSSPPCALSSSAPPEITTHQRKIPWVATWVLLVSFSAITASALVVGLHGQHGFFVPVLAASVCLLAALFDASSKRIPNALTYTAILAGLAINLLSTGLAAMHINTATRWLAAPGAQQALLGFSICAAIGIVGFLIARVGGGDIKLLAALGALLGLSNVGFVLIAGLSVAALYALLNLAIRGRLNAALRLAGLRSLELLYLRQFNIAASDPTDPAPLARDTIPMAVPLAIGLLISQIWNIKLLVLGAAS